MDPPWVWMRLTSLIVKGVAVILPAIKLLKPS